MALDGAASGQPFLSVIMPVHEGTEWIAATLDSVAAEPMRGVEIIAIDSSSTPGTADLIETYSGRLPIRLFRRPDIIPWQAKTNFGVELASADHVCILHQDDLWLRGRIPAVRRWIAVHPSAALHLAPSDFIDRHGRPIGPWKCPLPAERSLNGEFVLRRLLVQNFVSVPAPVFSRSAWLAAGGMDPQLWYTPDWDIWAKLAVIGPVVYHREPTTAFRVHSNSQTVAGSRDADDFRKQMELVLDRHIGRLPASDRSSVERAARASIGVNVSLASASGGNLKAIGDALRRIVGLGPYGAGVYLHNSRLAERVLSRLRAKLAGTF